MNDKWDMTYFEILKRVFRDDIVVNIENELCEQSLNSVSFLLIPLRSKSCVLLPSFDVLIKRSYHWCVKFLENGCVSTWTRHCSGNQIKNLLTIFTEFDNTFMCLLMGMCIYVWDTKIHFLLMSWERHESTYPCTQKLLNVCGTGTPQWLGQNKKNPQLS